MDKHVTQPPGDETIDSEKNTFTTLQASTFLEVKNLRHLKSFY